MRLFKSKSATTEISQIEIAPPTGQGPQSGIALMVLVKNEGAAIGEWLRFHLAAGVDHFLIYNDGSTDNTVAVARDTVPADQLTIMPWSQRLKQADTAQTIHNQALGFAHAVSNFGDRFRWMGFFDIDEFIYPTSGTGLAEVLAGMDHVDNMHLPWQMFGRQGFAETPDLTLPHFVQRMRDPLGSTVKGMRNFKCFVNPMAVTKVYVHGFAVHNSTQIWNPAGQAMDYSARSEPSYDDHPQLKLNHYYAKSTAQLDEKINKGSIGYSKFTRQFKKMEERRQMLTGRVLEIERDTVEDRGILDFCDRIGFSYGH